MNIFTLKLKEVCISVIPVSIIVLILCFTLTPQEPATIGNFIFGSVFIILGLSIFLVGVDLAITPIGNLMGSLITKSNKLIIIAIAGLGLGFFISIAEPDLHILAGQVSDVTGGILSKWLLVIVVSIGIAVLLMIGLLRIVKKIKLYRLLTVLYLMIFALALFTSREFLAISFDASGATTGAMTVPFIIALAIGVSSLKKNSEDSELDSFGLVAVASTGAIMSVMLLCIIFDLDSLSGTSGVSFDTLPLFKPFIDVFGKLFFESIAAILPIFILFIVFQKISFKLDKTSFHRINMGLIYTILGLTLFLCGVNGGFIFVGKSVGFGLCSGYNSLTVVIVGFVLGLVTILAEPAVHVLTHQIEEVTAGYVKRKVVLAALSIGVAFAVALSVIRVLVEEINLWHYLLPGYIIAVVLMYFCPKLFVGIAFDSGGVASGPMTATFILAFTQGAAQAAPHADVLVDGFGVIAMVALTPLIALQILGIIFEQKSKRRKRQEEKNV